MRPRALSLLLILGVGCRKPLPDEGLPDALAAVVWLEDGQLLSMLVELPRPGVDPTVRLAEGALAVDKGWGRTWLSQVDDEGRPVSVVMDLAGDGAWRAPVDEQPELWSLDRDGAVLRFPGALLLQPARPGAGLERLATLPPPGGRQEHPGPAGGFAVRVQDGHLDVRLPRPDGAAWTTLLRGVDHLVGSWWIVTTALPPWQRRVVDDRFKKVGLLQVQPGAAQLDGDLSEWQGTEALRVDHPAQILQGQTSWGGERDGAFGVAVRARGERAVLAIRVRDDRVQAPGDLLIVRSGTDELLVPLDGHAGRAEAGDWRAVLGARRGWDQGVEVEVPLSALDGMVVQLVDADPGQDSTLLATAPYPAVLEHAALAVTPEGPLRPAPQ